MLCSITPLIRETKQLSLAQSPASQQVNALTVPQWHYIPHWPWLCYEWTVGGSNRKKTQSSTIKHCRSVHAWVQEMGTETLELQASYIQKLTLLGNMLSVDLLGFYVHLSVQLSPILLSWAYMDCFMMTYPLRLEGHLTFLNMNSRQRHTHHQQHLNRPYRPFSLQATKSTLTFLPLCFISFTHYDKRRTSQLTSWGLGKSDYGKNHMKHYCE